MAAVLTRWFASHSQMFGSRQFAVFMAGGAIIRVIAWTALIVGYIFRVGFVVTWFDSVAFVSVLSALALLLTDWAQFAASSVGLSVVERAEVAAGIREDVAQDIEQLVAMAEREEAAAEAREVAERLKAKL
jgi:membrane protein implicated in regulation of membrane protease activity